MKPVQDSVELSPEQIEFCARIIPDFIADGYQTTIAGRAGSDRQFIRLSSRGSNRSYILILWNGTDVDWDRFFTINQEILGYLSIVPKVFERDRKLGLVLEEDCGHFTLKEYIANRNPTHQELIKLYKRVLDALLAWQAIPMVECPDISSRSLDEEVFLWETDYFSRHCVSEYFGLGHLLTDRWHGERRHLAMTTAMLPRVCLHRDFQSENIMILDEGIKFVDFQGARLGAAQYDLASLLFDPYMPSLTDEIRTELVGYYQENYPAHFTTESFRRAAMQRLAQALGAYGNLYLNKKKEKYKSFIPCALHRLSALVEEVKGDFPAFHSILSECRRKCDS